MARIIDFYSNSTDHRGRTHAWIIAQDDDWLERTHDFIQWLFPLRERSGANPHAPLLDAAQIAEFQASPALRAGLLASYDRMLRFYGLQRDGAAVAKGSNWNQRKPNWFTQPTHNDLRITRMQKCLVLLGLAEHARGFHAALRHLAREPGCGFRKDALAYWDDAVRDP